jgi:hypothetical protein
MGANRFRGKFMNDRMSARQTPKPSGVGRSAWTLDATDRHILTELVRDARMSIRSMPSVSTSPEPTRTRECSVWSPMR